MIRALRKRIMKLLLFLLAGAIINVAVAWGCAYGCIRYFDLFDASAVRSFGFRQKEVQCERYPQWVDETLATLEQQELVRTRISPLAKNLNREIIVQEAGWPVYTVCCEKYFGRYLFNSPGALSVGDDRKFLTAACIELPLETDPYGMCRDMLLGPSRLPIRPAWPGFAINTIFYAAIVWMLFAVPGAVRRRLRHKRGQCASCGYSLRGRDITSEKCPECGATV